MSEKMKLQVDCHGQAWTLARHAGGLWEQQPWDFENERRQRIDMRCPTCRLDFTVTTPKADAFLTQVATAPALGGRGVVPLSVLIYGWGRKR